MTLYKCCVKLAVVDLWIINNSSKTKYNLQDINKKRNTKGLRIRSHYEVLIVLFIVILLLSVTIKSQQDSVPVSHPCGANVYTLRKKNDVPFRWAWTNVVSPKFTGTNKRHRWLVRDQQIIALTKNFGPFCWFHNFPQCSPKVTKNTLL